MQTDKRVVLVAAYADNRVIGADGDIPWHISDDFAHFKTETLGHTLIMGRATWTSIGRPLPGRTTVVLTRDRSWTAGQYADQVLVAHSLAEALEKASHLDGDIVIAGGGEVYAQSLALATHMVLTEVHASPEGDAFFPEFDRSEWDEVRRITRDDLDWVWLERIA